MGNVVWRAAPTEAELLADAKVTKLREINAAYTEALKPMVTTYPEIERLSWDKQQREAIEYQAWLDAGGAGTPPVTPVLDQILAGRNGTTGSETLTVLATKVLANAQQFIAAQQLTGKRHRLEKAVQESTSIAEVASITW